MTKTLIIIRHAHRDKIPDADNGLSEKGRKQAKRVRDFFRSRYGKPGAYLISSPKLRCIETLAPIGALIGGEIEVSPLLDEGDRLEERAKQFYKEWITEGPELTVISSHGDWIPLFLELATGAQLDLAKGGYAELEAVEGLVCLTWLVQEP